MKPILSIERTSSGRLRCLAAAAHVERMSNVGRQMNLRQILCRALVAGATIGFASLSLSQPAPPSDVPAWLRERIETYAKSPLGASPSSIWKFEVNGKLVFYIPAPCCDKSNELFDADGHYICALDGGFSGKGDPACSPAHAAPANMRLVWEDPRLGLTRQPQDTTK